MQKCFLRIFNWLQMSTHIFCLPYLKKFIITFGSCITTSQRALEGHPQILENSWCPGAALVRSSRMTPLGYFTLQSLLVIVKKSNIVVTHLLQGTLAYYGALLSGMLDGTLVVSCLKCLQFLKGIAYARKFLLRSVLYQYYHNSVQISKHIIY